MEQPDLCAEPSRSLSLDEALARILASLPPATDSERLPLKQMLGRVLAEDTYAPFDLPPFPNSAMDGYALRHRDIETLGEEGLEVIGTSFAGRPYLANVEAGQCARIFTGAAMPTGADTVVMQEHVRRVGSHILLTRPVSVRANVRPVGDEVRAGERLLEKGRRLLPADLGVLASAGIDEAWVMRKLRVAFFSTGDELQPLGQLLGPGQIHDSNRYTLQGLLQNPAIDLIDLGVVRDDPAALRQTLRESSSALADVIISSGGVSVGDADFVTGALAELGRVDFWKVAVKPGKPFVFGRIGQSWFFGLPGNPVAVMVIFLQLVRPALFQLMGTKPIPPLRLSAVCRSNLKKSAGRMEFQRGVFSADGSGGLEVEGIAAQGSNQLLGISRSNCFIVLPPESTGVQAGDRVLIEPFIESFA